MVQFSFCWGRVPFSLVTETVDWLIYYFFIFFFFSVSRATASTTDTMKQWIGGRWGWRCSRCSRERGRLIPHLGRGRRPRSACCEGRRSSKSCRRGWVSGTRVLLQRNTAVYCTSVKYSAAISGVILYRSAWYTPLVQYTKKKGITLNLTYHLWL